MTAAWPSWLQCWGLVADADGIGTTCANAKSNVCLDFDSRSADQTVPGPGSRCCCTVRIRALACSRPWNLKHSAPNIGNKADGF